MSSIERKRWKSIKRIYKSTRAASQGLIYISEVIVYSTRLQNQNVAKEASMIIFGRIGLYKRLAIKANSYLWQVLENGT